MAGEAGESSDVPGAEILEKLLELSRSSGNDSANQYWEDQAKRLTAAAEDGTNPRATVQPPFSQHSPNGYEVVLESVDPEFTVATVFAIRLITYQSLDYCWSLAKNAPSVIARPDSYEEACRIKSKLEQSFKPPGWGKSGDPLEFAYRIPSEGEKCGVVSIREATEGKKPGTDWWRLPEAFWDSDDGDDDDIEEHD